MKIASLADVKAKLSAYVDEAQDSGPVVITRNGKVAAVLLSPTDDDDLEALLLARSPKLNAILDRSRRSLRRGKGLESKDFWQAANKRKTAARSK